MEIKQKSDVIDIVRGLQPFAPDRIAKYFVDCSGQDDLGGVVEIKNTYLSELIGQGIPFNDAWKIVYHNLTHITRMADYFQKYGHMPIVGGFAADITNRFYEIVNEEMGKLCDTVNQYLL